MDHIFPQDADEAGGAAQKADAGTETAGEQGVQAEGEAVEATEDEVQAEGETQVKGEEAPAYIKQLLDNQARIDARLNAIERGPEQEEAEVVQTDPFEGLADESTLTVGQLKQLAARQREATQKEVMTESREKAYKEALEGAAELQAEGYDDILTEDGQLGGKYAQAVIDLYGYTDQRGFHPPKLSGADRLKAAVQYLHGKKGAGRTTWPANATQQDNSTSRLEGSSAASVEVGSLGKPEDGLSDEDIKKWAKKQAEIAKKKGG